MNANRTPWLRACATSFALAIGLLAPGVLRAEIGVVTEPGTSVPLVVYILDGSTEDPSPINPVWRKFTPNDLVHFTLNAAGEANGDGTPSLLSDANTGLVVAAWAKKTGGGFDIVVSRFADGAWTAPQVVAGSTADELDPRLALGADGSIHMVYWVNGLTPQVFHVVAPADLSSWSTPLRVSQIDEPSCRPAGGFHDGILRVAYEVHNFGNGNTPRQVVLARFENGAFTPEVVAMTSNMGDVRPEVHSHAGHLWVDWVDDENSAGEGELAWTRLNTLGQWETIRYEPFDNFEQRQHLVRGGARMHAITAP
jgi:hypothetical protein